MEKNLTSRSVLHYIAVFRMLMRSEKISMKEADYMSQSELFGIGDVAKMFHISASSLRHYENIGILKPEKVDPDSGYRYYSSRQFEVLNSIRYLRALDMPLSEIDDFLQNRDVNVIEKKLKEQKKVVLAKAEELRRIERKINNRLSMIEDARGSIFDEVHLIQKGSCRMIWIKASLKIGSYLDMEHDLFGERYTELPDVIESIKRNIADGFTESERAKEMRPKYFKYIDSDNSKRTYEYLKSKGY